MLEVCSISKFYGDKMAIQDISFSASTGQIIGLLGHNGCGKSTTMNIIANCLIPSSGQIFIHGVSASEQPLTVKRQIGYLPEIPPIYPDMTVQEQLAFACGLRRIPRSQYEQQIQTVCEYLNISGVRKRMIHNLSKGYRQRVGFAQALIGNPELLILDEPTVGLDPHQIMELRELILRLRKDHLIILSSHILSEITAVCDRIIVLSNGHLAADDTLQGLISRGTSQMRLLLQADGSPEMLLPLIRSIPAVEQCQLGQDPITGNVEYYIQTVNNQDIHRELFACLSAADTPIRSLHLSRPSLEDIFLQLTQDQRYLES